MIAGFRDTETEVLWKTMKSRRFPPSIQRQALRKLVLLDAASLLDELRLPPGNRLEALRGDRMGQHSIRINQQYRVCFRWHDGNAYDVEIVDYH